MVIHRYRLLLRIIDLPRKRSDRHCLSQTLSVAVFLPTFLYKDR